MPVEYSDFSKFIMITLNDQVMVKPETNFLLKQRHVTYFRKTPMK